MNFLRLSPFVLLLTGSLFATAQQRKEQPGAWQHPIFTALEKKVPHLVSFGREKEDNWYVPLAVLDKTKARLYYLNTFGYVFDSLPVGPVLQKELIARRKDAFAVYTSLVTTESLNEVEEVKAAIRLNTLDTTALLKKPHYFNYTPLVQAASPMEQMAWLANLEKLVWQRHYLLGMALNEKTDTAYTQKRFNYRWFEPAKIKLHGQKQVDSVEFTASNRFSRLARAVLQPATATIYMYNGQEQVVDSFKVKEENLKDLSADKQDVFALYRMWLEWQLEHTIKEIDKLLPQKTVANGAVAPLRVERGWGEVSRLDTLLNHALHTEQKIRYATQPDKDLLLVNLLEQTKKTPRKNWNTAAQQWQAVAQPGVLSNGGEIRTFTRGAKEYFLTDHRGNVMATVSDRKLQVDENHDGIVDYYVADVVTATDYAPFGSLLAGRSYRSNGQQLRYGYNGKENDIEVKGEGNQQDYGFRIYDPRLGKFLSVDPLTKGYPELTPYQFASNSPIAGIDLDGLEFFYSAEGASLGHLGKSNKIIIVNDKDLVQSTKELIKSWGGEKSEYSLDPTAIKYTDGTKPYDNFSDASSDARNMVIKSIYSANIKGKAASIKTEKIDNPFYLAYTDKDGNITMDHTKKWNGEILFNNQHNLVNDIYHEELHANKKYSGNDGNTEHLLIFVDQLNHNSWEKASANYKEAILNGAYENRGSLGSYGYIATAEGHLSSLVNHSTNRKSVFDNKINEQTFNQLYDIYKRAVDAYNKNTTGEKKELKSKDNFKAVYKLEKK